MKHPCASGTDLNDGEAILAAVREQNRKPRPKPKLVPMTDTAEERTLKAKLRR